MRVRQITTEAACATLWSLSVDQLRARQPAAVQLLGLCAYLAPEPIPLDLFTDHSGQLPSPLSGVVGDPLAFAETVGALLDYSLARRTGTGLLLHRLVQGVIRHPGSDQPADPHPLPVVLDLLRADLPWEIMAGPENWPRWQQLLPHVLTATAHHDDAKPTAASATAWLLDRAAIYQHTHGRSAAARPLLERAVHVGETAHGPDHPHVAATLTNLAWVLNDLGEPATARPLGERALHIYETAYGPDHPKVASALNIFAAALRTLGELATARGLLERALCIREGAHGPDHPEVAITPNHLALALVDLGELGTARRLLERALHIRETAYGPNHPQVAIALNNLALVLRHLGEPTTARPLLHRALHIYESAYGPDYPASLRVRQELRQLDDTPV